MSVLYGYWTVGIGVMYLVALFLQKKYRLLLPSTLHTMVWSITALLMIFQIKGTFVTKSFDSAFSLSSEYMCFLVISSIIGFITAHIYIESRNHFKSIFVDIDVVNAILKRFVWIPYVCAIIGVSLIGFLLSVGGIESFNDYRTIAITVERVGYMQIIQRISGHISILGTFYLMLLGYQMGQTSFNVKKFLYYVFLCSAINIAIGGRVWILNSTLPFFVTYCWVRNSNFITRKSDKVKIIYVLVFFVCLFSVVGMLRSKDYEEESFMNKFLYFTDGARMTNMVLTSYPPGSFDLELGKSEFLSPWIKSPMAERFNESISYDVGLSVTVKSSMPSLYYDFGYAGGIIMWGVFCFFIELFCLIQRYKRATIIGILLFGQLAILLFQAPIFPVFALNTPSFEWILLLCLFRKKIFANIKNINQYL